MKLNAALALLPCVLLTWRCDALSWNIPGHMLSGAIAYQILQRESPSTIPAIHSILKKHPWYESRWKAQLDKLPESERDEMLFMLAPRWADDIRRRDLEQHRRQWHYINWPFKPEGEPASVQVKPPEPVNILTAIVENKHTIRNGTDPAKQVVSIHSIL